MSFGREVFTTGPPTITTPPTSLVGKPLLWRPSVHRPPALQHSVVRRRELFSTGNLLSVRGKRELDANGGSFRWAYTRLVEHQLKRNLVALIAIPVIGGVGGLFAHNALGSHGLKPYWAVVLGGLAAYAIVFIVLGSLAVIVAPYEQRSRLRQKLKDADSRLATLNAAEPEVLVEASHAKELYWAIERVITDVERNRPVSVDSPVGRRSMLAHFPEVRIGLESWNNLASKRRAIEELIEAKFDGRIADLSLKQAGFSSKGLADLLDQVKSESLNGHLAVGGEINWYHHDEANPDDLRLASGQHLITASQTEPSLVLQTCKIRLNEFVRDMRQWPEMASYGTPDSVIEFNESRAALLALLDIRRYQRSYFRKSDCPQCPHR